MALHPVRFLVVLVGLLAASRPLAIVETGTISGHVRDSVSGAPIPNASVIVAGTAFGAIAKQDGSYVIANVPVGKHTVVARFIGYKTKQKSGIRVTANAIATVDFRLEMSVLQLQEMVVTGAAAPAAQRSMVGAMSLHAFAATDQYAPGGPGVRFDSTEAWRYQRLPGNREQYDEIVENPFIAVAADPLSTFSIDVDRASYSNMRRFIMQDGQLPPRDAVRIEELVNYFPYDYADPDGDAPLAIHAEVGPAPWKSQHQLVRIGLQARRVNVRNLPASNFVFLLDVSGSMMPPNKLPLVKAAMRLLVNELRPKDRVAIVVYAGSAGLVLPSTAGDQKDKILDAIEQLEAGGSTAGGAGIRLAYDQAVANFIRGGNNRVILATDGDFNVGASSDAEMVQLIEEKRRTGVFLTVLGVGEGNLQAAKMEKLADKGNGNYSYLDTITEAQKVLVHELGGTLYTVAKDVKIQVEWNPARVRAYRLIGYENRLLRNEDFTDDKKDAGEVGSGHSVTALYELVRVGVTTDVTIRMPDSLRYQRRNTQPSSAAGAELLFVQVRYKQPDGDESRLLTQPVLAGTSRAPSVDFQFQAAVAEFGLLLRNSEFRGKADLARVIAAAREARGTDRDGYRAEFVKLAEAVRGIGVARRDGAH
ncbi:MAG TPA: von Willebrand factor type A domain-containing protein [Gemmatimonadales bacterium]|nr:von Willebrand factor type A domain-containing protein [Gemmatimonadales bacterium]